MFKNPKERGMVYNNMVDDVVSLMSSDDKIIKTLSMGLIADMNLESAEKVKKNSNVAVVEEDAPVRIAFNHRSFDDVSFLKNREEPYFIEKLGKKVLFKKNNHKKWIFPRYQSDNFPLHLKKLYGKQEFKKNDINELKKTQIHGMPWGLKKIIDSNMIQNDNKFPIFAGKNVEVYVIDTGIDINHPEFEGRARFGANFVENESDKDENGHGTHVAGIVGSRCCGVAKKTNIVSVKVLNKDGSGVISRVIEGIDFVINEHSKKFDDESYDSFYKKFENSKKPLIKKNGKITLRNNFQILNTENDNIFNSLEYNNRGTQTVINMSVGGVKNRALEYAIEFAKSIGIHISAAAGNDHKDACDYSPSSSKNAITVGASDKDDHTAFFSNFGRCVDIYAPGVDIPSLWLNNEYRIASGTSMASPHVAGSMAVILDINFYKPTELYEKLIHDSQKVVDNDKNSKWPFNFWHNGLPLLSLKNFINELKDKNNEEINK